MAAAAPAPTGPADSAALKTRKFDVVVLGASGFTGERIALYLLRAVHGLPTGNQVAAADAADAKTPASPAPASVADAKSSARKRTIAIAGRSAPKLAALRQRLYKQLQRDAGAAGGAAAEAFSGVKEEDICAVIGGVEVADDASLHSCAGAARVLINAVGPYRYYGEAVVRACLAARTHYVDITGETEFMERMHLLYDAEAQRVGVTVVMACGFDSLIADMGVVFTQRAFAAVHAQAVLSRVDSVLRVYGTGKAGVTGHVTTLEALLESLANVKELRKNRKALKAKQTEQFGEIARVGRDRKPGGLLGGLLPLRYDARVGRYTLPFMGSDSSVVRNSQYSCYAQDKAAGARSPTYPYFATYFSLPSLFWAVVCIVMGLVLFAASRFRITRSLMNRYPALLTYGAFTHAGPTPTQLQETRMQMDFFGEGYASEEAAAAVAAAAKDNRKSDAAQVLRIHTAVTGPEPGYIACSIVCGQSAFTLLDELDAAALAPADAPTIPRGVLTPAPAFRGTDLIERCHAEGVRFQVVAAPVAAPAAAAAGAAK